MNAAMPEWFNAVVPHKMRLKQAESSHSFSVVRPRGLGGLLMPPFSKFDSADELQEWVKARLAGLDEQPRISVIVPARNEQQFLAATLRSVLCCDGAEIIVVDGQSSDRTADIARWFGATVVSVSPSRGNQLNAGAAVARADVLLFLHADTCLPPDYVRTACDVLHQPGTAAGAFTLQIDASGLPFRLIEWGVRVRSNVFGRPYGDQAYFMKTRTFLACGGFPGLPRMEDYAMLARLRKLGRICVVPAHVRTSARSWQKYGPVRTILQHQWIILKYHLARGPREQRSYRPES